MSNFWRKTQEADGWDSHEDVYEQYRRNPDGSVERTGVTRRETPMSREEREEKIMSTIFTKHDDGKWRDVPL